MARLAIVSGGRVVNTVVGDQASVPGSVVMGANGVPEMSIGDLWDGTAHTVPEVQQVKTWDLLQLYREFTPEEQTAILAATATAPGAAVFIQMALATTVSGARLRADDPDLIRGFEYFVSTGLLTEGRKLAILG